MSSGWHPDFVAGLRAMSHAPQYLVRPVRTYDGPKASFRFSSDFRNSTTQALGGMLRGSGERVSPISWSGTSGDLTIKLAGNDVTGIKREWTRGLPVEVLLGWPGLPEANWGRIFLGQYWNIRGAPPSFELTLRGWQNLLNSRMSLDKSKLVLFGDAFDSTTVAANWTAGSAADLQVASTSSFSRKTGGKGALLCTPSGGGDPFYLTYTGTGTGPTRFTGIPAADQYDTTQSNLVIGDTVQEVKLLSGHPCTIIREVLLSTGAGTNGVFDTLPEEWGFSLPRELVDHAGFNDVRTKILGTSVQWDVLITADVGSPRSWLLDLCRSSGLLLVMRQGQISIRPVQNPVTAHRLSGLAITDEELVGSSVTSSDYLDEQSVQYQRTRIYYGGAGLQSTVQVTAARVGSLPAQLETSRTLPHVFAGADATEVRDRLAVWDQRLIEPINLTVRGWELAQLCVGDFTRLTTSRVYGRLEALRGGGYNVRPAFVASVNPSWTGAGVSLELWTLPTWEGEFPQ